MLNQSDILYSEAMNQKKISDRYQTSYEFWKLAQEYLLDQRMAFKGNAWSFKRTLRKYRKKAYRNKKMANRVKHISEKTMSEYQRVLDLERGMSRYTQEFEINENKGEYS